MSMPQAFNSLPELATFLRQVLQTKKYVMLYAYNGTGKTRLSTAFKDLGKDEDQRDTLYFNAFTEDLFSWDNDLDNDSDRRLKLNRNSRFFDGLVELEMDTRIRKLLDRFADFDFRIDTDEWVVRFVRTEDGQLIDNIKVSRGEENIFIWCFFLAVLQLAIDQDPAYAWVKHVYIDDPISSLDEHNAIAVANHVAQMLKRQDHQLTTVISSHHTLFFNVLCNELKNARKYVLAKGAVQGTYLLREEVGDTPFFHHVAALCELYEAARAGRLYTYHFNMLRSILEKTSSFHGYGSFSACIRQGDDDQDGILHTRLINILSHGNYSLYEPREMLEENKAYFMKILNEFLKHFPFNSDLFPGLDQDTQTP